jgi:hypothetical protein
MCSDRPVPMRLQLVGLSVHAAPNATAGTAAPAPAAAPSTQSGGCRPRNRSASNRINANPGAMKQTPPMTAPAMPLNRQAQKIAI